MPTCELEIKDLCTGEDLRKIQLKTMPNVYDGAVVLACAGCRKARNGSYKNVIENKPSKFKVRLAEAMKASEEQRAQGTESVPVKKPRAKVTRSYNAKDLENWKFDDQELPEEWHEHLGELPGVFSMYVDGHPGNGKTEYIMKLAKMLAMHVGKTRLNNVEQGKHKQIQQSAVRNEFSKNIPAGKFAYDNIRDFDKFVERIKRPNSGKIILIDSISYWPLTLKQVQYLLANFKNKIFVFVAYEKHYTANEPIIHHCDIKVRVSNFTAKVVASRYGGMKDFIVWDQKKPVTQLELGITASN